jgi:two-component system nitrogen regulation response regulator NtrX
MNTSKVLIVDDEAEVRSLMSDVLADEGYHAESARDEQEAFARMKKSPPDLVFLDLWIDEDESAGLKILKKIQRTYPDIPIVIISGHGTIDVAIQAIQKGAADFIEKPFVIDRLLLTCKKTLEISHLKMQNSVLRQNRFDSEVFAIGKSAFAQSIMLTIDRVAPTNSRIFIRSNIGLRADSIAYQIHKRSLRKDSPFIQVNCFSDEKNDFEAKLFGTEQTVGQLEIAHAGTIFLNEISKLSKRCQMRLLQLLQEGTYAIGKRIVRLDARIISCASDDIDQLISLSKFSQELYYRLNIIRLDVPSLRDRREDILPLINHYLENSETLFGLQPKKFTENATIILQANDWPGNIYQVKNVVESSLISSINSEKIEESALPSEFLDKTKDKFISLDTAKLVCLQIKEAKEYFESDYLRTQIDRFSGNISKTAEFIGMERSALHRRLKTLGIVSNRRDERK